MANHQISTKYREIDELDKAIIKAVRNTNKALSNAEIGRITGLDRETVNRRLNSPQVQALLFELDKPALKVFEENQNEAARFMLKTMRDTSISMKYRVKAAETILRHILPTNVNFNGKIDNELNVNVAIEEVADKWAMMFGIAIPPRQKPSLDQKVLEIDYTPTKS